MFVICIARHKYLSDHLCSVFSASGIEAAPAVGFEEGALRARAQMPEVVICDYDLLTSAPLQQWERDEILAGVPVLAVSMTRRPEEAQLLDTNGIAGFFYLPTLTPEDARAMVLAAANAHIRPPYDVLHWDAYEPERRAEPR